LDRSGPAVAGMFDAVARRYDVANDVLSAGQDRWWRHAVTRLCDVRPNDRVLDLGAGTGTSTAPLASRGAVAVACDFSAGMLREGRRRRPVLPFVAGDGNRLPFRADAFDLVTTSFGLRNIADVDQALRELRRVCRPGGRLVVCEFSRPTLRPLRAGYGAYLRRGLPLVARLVSSNPQAYRYLSESVLAWPDQPTLAGRIRACGWSDVRWCNLSGGIVAVHIARRP
jgi:demethylmenaquinone methyltransferase/2-methoxy-6-polyprenyl-1,4-benzoquinol methylase